MDANKIITLTVICYLYETRPVDFSCVLFIYLFILLRILLLLSEANDRLHGPLKISKLQRWIDTIFQLYNNTGYSLVQVEAIRSVTH